MHIQSGKHGGQDVSNASTVETTFIKDENGLQKVTCTGQPGEKHAVALPAPGSHKHYVLTQTQKSNAKGGFGDAAGNIKFAIAGQGAGLSVYDPSAGKPDTWPINGKTVTHVILEIGADGKPATYTWGEGPAI